MTKIERELKRRERRRLADLNRNDRTIWRGMLSITLAALAIMIGAIIWWWAASMQAIEAEAAVLEAHWGPGAEIVGPITEAAPEALPEAVNEVSVATMPDAEMVEPVGTRWEYLGRWKTTGFCPCRRCNGRNAGRTASGAPMIPGRTIAVGGLPFGTVLKVGNAEYVVEDRGTPYGHIDILYGDHRTASSHGIQYREVWIKR